MLNAPWLGQLMGRCAINIRWTGRTGCAAHFTRGNLLICKESDASTESAADFLLTSSPRRTVLLWYFLSSFLSSFGSSPVLLLQPFNSEVCLIQCPARVKCRLDTKSAPPRPALRKITYYVSLLSSAPFKSCLKRSKAA